MVTFCDVLRETLESAQYGVKIIFNQSCAAISRLDSGYKPADAGPSDISPSDINPSDISPSDINPSVFKFICMSPRRINDSLWYNTR